MLCLQIFRTVNRTPFMGSAGAARTPRLLMSSILQMCVMLVQLLEQVVDLIYAEVDDALYCFFRLAGCSDLAQGLNVIIACARRIKDSVQKIRTLPDLYRHFTEHDKPFQHNQYFDSLE